MQLLPDQLDYCKEMNIHGSRGPLFKVKLSRRLGYRVFIPEQNKIRVSSHVDDKEDQEGADHFEIWVRTVPETLGVNNPGQRSMDVTDFTAGSAISNNTSDTE
jgi:hypothetical protein